MSERVEEPEVQGNGGEKVVRRIIKLYKDKLEQGTGAGAGAGSGTGSGDFGLAFNRSQQRMSIGANSGERHQLFTETGEELEEGVKTINVLSLTRRARLPLDALITALSESGDLREVHLRTDPNAARHDDDEAEDAPLVNGSPVKYVDISFTEALDISCPSGGVEEKEREEPALSGFGLLLSPGTASPKNSDGSRDAFREWLSDAPKSISPAHRVSVAVEMPSQVDTDHEAFLVLDPTSVMEGNPQWVFAVPTVQERSKENLESRLCSHFPSEVAAVTVYCEQGTSSSSLATVIVSIELSRPAWAWFVLFVGVVAASVTEPLVTHLNLCSNDPTYNALWWGTSNLFVYFAMFMFTYFTHEWRPSELSLLRDMKQGVAVLAVLGMLWAGYAVTWTNATNETDESGSEPGPTAQASVMHALHPLYILLYRAVRMQPVFPGELFGLGLLLIGMTFIALPKEGGWRDWAKADALSTVSAILMAAYLIGAKTVASQLPVSIILFPTTLLAMLPLLIATLAAGGTHASGHDGVFGWADGDTCGNYFVSLLFISSLQMVCFIHALRYLHPLAVSAAMCLSAMISIILTNYDLFPNIHITDGFGTSFTVPGILVAVIGCVIAIYSTAVRRQNIEIEITSENITKRQRSKFKLTPTTLQRSQDVYDTSLYATASKGQDKEE